MTDARNSERRSMRLEALCALIRDRRDRCDRRDRRDRGPAVRTHSGAVRPGDVFVVLPKAAPGNADFSDAGRYLADALRAGAAYVVCPEGPTGAALLEEARRNGPEAGGAACCVHVADVRAALGELARAVHGTGETPVDLVGVTGTNGKTTETYLLEALLRAAGKRTGVIGTIEYRWPGHCEPSPLTTPGCLELHAMLAAMREAGTTAAIMEVSSHALDQRREAGLSFTAALFTNLTQDHLDYHRDMEEYFQAKARLFLDPEKGGVPVPGKALAINADDAYGARLLAMCPTAVGYGFTPGAAAASGFLTGRVLEQSRDGLHLRMAFRGTTWDLASPLVGAFNAANLLGAQALGLAMGLDPALFQTLAGFSGVPGRLERVRNAQDLAVFVDYAHTPDALAKALQALRGAGFMRVVTVFGCGGNRDRTKRPLMGKAAAALSDLVVLTSDNPRKEDPLAIMADVRPGLAGAAAVIEEPDRKKAVGLALAELKPGDALLIAGKGHELYQIIGDTRYPFSDQLTVKELLGCA